MLDRAARLDTERDTLSAKGADAEAVAAEWEEADDSDLSEAVDLVRALQDVDNAQALNAALSQACRHLRQREEVDAHALATRLTDHPDPDPEVVVALYAIRRLAWTAAALETGAPALPDLDEAVRTLRDRLVTFNEQANERAATLRPRPRHRRVTRRELRARVCRFRQLEVAEAAVELTRMAADDLAGAGA